MARQDRVATSRSLVIDVARLARRPGALLTVREQVPSPSRVGLDLVAIEAGGPIDLDLRIESVSEGVLVTGTVGAPTAGECARCLATTTGRVEVALTELFGYPDRAIPDDELAQVVNDTVDLGQAIVDAVGLALPLSPLCRPDCPGLCSQCGVALATAEPGHHHEQIDPRWAKLVGRSGPATAESDR